MKIDYKIEARDPVINPKKIYDEAESALEEVLALLEREVLKRTPVGATGLLGKEIMSEIQGKLTGVFGTPVEYAEPVEFGTEPHWAPIAPLILWAQRKLGLTGGEAESAAYAIRLAIARRGTKGRKMFKKGLAASEGKIDRIWEQAGLKMTQEMSK